MNNMHEGPLLALLERRYGGERIYTYTGDILISLNPYKLISGLYDITEPGPATAAQDAAPSGPDYSDPRTPHVFTVAERAYRTMLEEANPSKRNQSLIVSGESGAGKTEACKYVMRYLASLSKRDVLLTTPTQPVPAASAAVISGAAGGDAPAAVAGRHAFPPTTGSASLAPPHITIPSVRPATTDAAATPLTQVAALGGRASSSSATADSIESKVLECNPFLEAFGNAKTLRNDNSSRFGA
jgi:myosin heavy subunit